MKHFSKLMVLGLALMVLAVGCGKKPEEEINVSKAAVDAIVTEGADSTQRMS